MFENIGSFFKKIMKTDQKELLVEATSKDAAKERLHIVLMQDRANVSADFLELMKQEIIDVIKKYIVIDEEQIDVRLTNQENEDGTTGAPSLYANIPILNIRNDIKGEVLGQDEKTKDTYSISNNAEAVISEESNLEKENVLENNSEDIKESEKNNDENIEKSEKEEVVENSEIEEKEEIKDIENSEDEEDDDDDVTFDDLLKAAEEEERIQKEKAEASKNNSAKNTNTVKKRSTNKKSTKSKKKSTSSASKKSK